MSADDFHDNPFDEGTLAKLELFQRYAEAWLPVFLAREKILWPHVNIFDFFAGAGTDGKGVDGSPLRLLNVVKGQERFLGRAGLQVSLYFSDKHRGKIKTLEKLLASRDTKGINLDVRRAEFADRFAEAKAQIAATQSANLLIIDQFGVKEVPDEVFSEIVNLPTTDLLFFISSNTFRRFGQLPEVARLTMPGYQRPSDYYRAHLAVADAYRNLVPKNKQYFIASFSIKKGSNVYGVIFGSAHPLGMDKFLEVAWNQDKVSGDANFDVYREGIDPNAPKLFAEMNVPTKIRIFEEQLANQILELKCRNEAEVIALCHRHGVRRKHAEPVLAQLRKERRIDCAFRVPDIDRLSDPRTITVAAEQQGGLLL